MSVAAGTKSFATDEWFRIATIRIQAREQAVLIETIRGITPIRLNLVDGFTIGMITAFGAYKQQFLSASLNVVGKLADYRCIGWRQDDVAENFCSACYIQRKARFSSMAICRPALVSPHTVNGWDR